MPLYLFFTVVPLALILGFLGGLWLSKRSLVWCPSVPWCGAIGAARR